MTGREADVNRQSHTAVSLAQQGAASALVLSPCLLSTMTKKRKSIWIVTAFLKSVNLGKTWRRWKMSLAGRGGRGYHEF